MIIKKNYRSKPAQILFPEQAPCLQPVGGHAWSQTHPWSKPSLVSGYRKAGL